MTINELFDDGDILYADKNLAKELGLNTAVVFAALQKYNEVEKDACEEQNAFDIKYIQERYLPFFSIDTIKRTIEKLKQQGYLNKKKISAEEIKEIVINGKKNPKYVCEWCGCGCNVLNEHHYPIPKSKGGKKIVKICPNCHYEFHSINKSQIIMGGI